MPQLIHWQLISLIFCAVRSEDIAGRRHCSLWGLRCFPPEEMKMQAFDLALRRWITVGLKQ